MVDKVMKEELSVTIKVPLSESLLADVMSIALEGGIGYWCYASDVKKTRELDYVSFVAHDCEDNQELGRVTHGTIVKGINLVLDESTRISSKVRSSVEKAIFEDDAVYIDAEEADCIVQLGLLGEIVYG